MKLKVVYILFGIAGVAILMMGNSIGRAEVGFGNTGAPGDAAGCFVTSCHVDTGQFGNETVIQVFEPGTENEITSYMPGITYDMRVTLNTTTDPGGYGFQIVCLKDTDETDWQGFTNPGVDVQIMIASSTMRQYAEHNKRSLTDTFNFQWIAPPEGTGNLTFYASGNAVDGNSFFTNDDPDTTFLNMPEFSGTVGVFDPQMLDASVEVFPNPASSYLNIDIESSLSGTFNLEILDVFGRNVYQETASFQGISTQLNVDISHLAPGFYVVRIAQDGKLVTTPVVKG
ncbi:MAG: choice-of-anchor V domain-containing protein [Bacteroidota bacterium]